MAENEIVIDDIDEVASLLSRAYWFEEEFEQTTQWDGYYSMDEKYRDLIFQLSHESEGHKRQIKKIIKNLEGIELEDIMKDASTKKNVEVTKSRYDEEVLGGIMKNDMLARDLYARLIKHVSKDLLEERWTGDDPEEFFKILAKLILDEKRHIDMVKPYVGKLERIT
ncbi:MAG: hypothetical protein R6U61_02750 [Thermoplasmata archaeon]